jgi:hypothetical protein
MGDANTPKIFLPYLNSTNRYKRAIVNEKNTRDSKRLDKGTCPNPSLYDSDHLRPRPIVFNKDPKIKTAVAILPENSLLNIQKTTYIIQAKPYTNVAIEKILELSIFILFYL